MRPEIGGDYLNVLAYQDITLTELRSLYDRLDLDLADALGREDNVSDGLDAAGDEMAELKAMLLEAGAKIPEGTTDPRCEEPESNDHREERAQASRYAFPFVPTGKDFDALVSVSEARLAELGVDPTRDPLLQVIPNAELSAHLKNYKETFGDVSWTRQDYAVVMLAGFLATLVDVLVVRIPKSEIFLGDTQKGSPMTEWLREKSPEIYRDYLKQFEKQAKVTYDDVRHSDVEGMRPDLHRLNSLGHDPILGFVFGTLDLMRGTGTYIDKNGNLIQVAKDALPVDLMTAFVKVFLHLLSDVCTSAGIQPPFFTLLQLVKGQSPFALGTSGVKVSWTDVARYMYTHGYDLRHFFTMGLVPAVVEIVIRGWWLLSNYMTDDPARNPKLTKAKLASMLMLGHTIAASGNLVKTGLIFGMNPLAMNWAQLLALFPTTLVWVKESVKRDRRIASTLDREYAQLLQSAGAL